MLATMSAPSPHEPLAETFRHTVATAISDFLASRTDLVERIGAGPVLAEAHAATAGGKRLRPAFCVWGYHGCASPEDSQALIRAAASLELLHASLLVHDDLIDASDTRRGRPATHRVFEQSLAGERAAAFGVAAAILTGDVLFEWSGTMFETSGMDGAALDRARPVLQEMRAEVLLGQYLDVAAGFSATGATDLPAQLAQAETALEYKSARYSVARPAQLGAALAGGTPEQIDTLGRFGSLVGQAFQLRDDVLGVFGDPELTGKPAGDDLREGKRTLLVLTALSRSTPAHRQRLESVLGRPAGPDDLDTARGIIRDSGALQAIEDRIATSREQALAELSAAPLDPGAVLALTHLTEQATHRDR